MSFEHTAYTSTFGARPTGRPHVRVSMPGARRSEAFHPHPDDWTPGVRGQNPWTPAAATKTLERHGWLPIGAWDGLDATEPRAPVRPVSDEARALAADPALTNLGQTLDAVPRRIAVGVVVAVTWVLALILTAAALLAGRGALTAWLVVFGVVFLVAAVVALIPPPHGRPAAVLAFAIGLPMLTAALVLAATAPPPTVDGARCAALEEIADEAARDANGGLLGIWVARGGAGAAEDYALDAADDAGCP